MEEIVKILVVDDDAKERAAVCQSLLAKGELVELLWATDCTQAIALLQQDNFDCIFLDYSLPDGEGLKLLDKLCPIGNVPIVMLTGQEDEKVAAELIKAGASDYISKAKISQWLNRSLANVIRTYRIEKEAANGRSQLQMLEERYRLVMEVSSDAIWDWDISKDEIHWNHRLGEIIGSPDEPGSNLTPNPSPFTERGEEQGREEIKAFSRSIGSQAQFAMPKLGCTWEEFSGLFHPEDKQKVSLAIAAHLDGKAEFNLEFRVRHISGEYRHCLTRGKAQHDASDKALRMTGIISDMTSAKLAEGELRHCLHQLQTIHQVTDAVSRASTTEEIYQAASSYLKVAFEADSVCVVVLDVDGAMRCQTICGLSSALKQTLEAYLPWSPDSNNPLPICIPDVEAQLQGKERKVYSFATSNFGHSFELLLSSSLSEGVRALGFIPLVAQQKLMGCLTLCYNKPHQFTESEMQLARTVADRVAFATLNKIVEEVLYPKEPEFKALPEENVGERLKRAIAVLGQRQQQLRTLQRLTNLLNQRLTNVPNLLQVMVQSVCNAVPKGQFSLMVLYNPQCSRLVLTVTAGIGTEKLRLEDAFGGGEGWLAKVASTGISHHIQGRRDLPASVYAVPIESAQAGRLGLLAIGNWDDAGAFTQEDRHLLMAVGEQAAIAINNARIIKMLEEREERLALQNEILARQNQELESQREQIQLQNLQLLEAARLKSQFLATVSHELRTPMNAVIGFSQLLLRQLGTDSSQASQSFTPEQVNMLERILNNGKHLLELINDILDLSKIEAGRMELEREQVNLETLVESTTEELRSLAQEKHLDLQVVINLSNSMVFNDGARLRQVLVNLLSNAIKFTYVGSVRVEAFELEPTRIAIKVTDTGIGIAEENLERIFDEFWQVDQSITKVHYGTGLGLAIIKSLVQLMKGTVRVESKLGEGSSFLVEIPREIPECSNQSLKKASRKLLK